MRWWNYNGLFEWIPCDDVHVSLFCYCCVVYFCFCGELSLCGGSSSGFSRANANYSHYCEFFVFMYNYTGLSLWVCSKRACWRGSYKTWTGMESGIISVRKWPRSCGTGLLIMTNYCHHCWTMKEQWHLTPSTLPALVSHVTKPLLCRVLSLSF